jgi:hypothetical protein
MITGPRVQFLARYTQRGYTWEQVFPCIVSENGDTITVDETHPAYPRAKPVPLLTKVANFAAAAVNHVAAGAPRCTDEQIAARHAICFTCPHYRDEACGLCGCPVIRESNYFSKLSWADQSCPDNPPRWGPV